MCHTDGDSSRTLVWADERYALYATHPRYGLQPRPLTEKRRTASKQFVTKPHPLGGTSTTGARAASCAIKEMRRLAMPPANCGAGRHSVQSSNDRCARHWNCRMGNHQSTIIDVHCLEPPDSRHTRQSGGQQLDFRADAPLPGVDDPADKGSRSLPHDTDRG